MVASANGGCGCGGGLADDVGEFDTQIEQFGGGFREAVNGIVD